LIRVLCGGQRPSGREHLTPSTHTHTHTHHTCWRERKTVLVAVRVVNEASGIQVGENKVNEGARENKWISINNNNNYYYY
jgi:hypothetical protein